jgi:hypothetical protein
MSLVDHLKTKSSEYERLAEWHAERAPPDDQHLAAYQAMLVVGIVLRELAEALGRSKQRRILGRPSGAGCRGRGAFEHDVGDSPVEFGGLSRRAALADERKDVEGSDLKLSERHFLFDPAIMLRCCRIGIPHPAPDGLRILPVRTAHPSAPRRRTARPARARHRPRGPSRPPVGGSPESRATVDTDRRIEQAERRANRNGAYDCISPCMRLDVDLQLASIS